MELALAAALFTLVILTITYQTIPFRLISNRKPPIAILPKYKNNITTKLSISELEVQLKNHGFEKIGTKNNTIYFTRGALLGDFSVKVMKIKLGITPLGSYKFEITLQAGWLVAFDTGDFWTFIIELSKKLETT